LPLLLLSDGHAVVSQQDEHCDCSPKNVGLGLHWPASAPPVHM
jgi:hypothetical protein